MMQSRMEEDSMGTIRVPADALYGAQTARAVENFPVSGWSMPRGLLAAVGLVKQAAAEVHRDAGRLEPDKADAIIAACQEVIEGDLDDHFVVDVFQTGSGTSTNMNANEVIANRANQLLGGAAGDRGLVHPNDDVNRGQSSNDVIPTALHVAAAVAVHHELVPVLRVLRQSLENKAEEFDDVIKIGRTHGMDAVPIRLGQEFSGYARQVELALGAIQSAEGRLCELAIGGTAVGTGLNAPEGFGAGVCAIISERLNYPFVEAANHFEAQAARDAAVQMSAALRGVALVLGKIASDIRLLGTGPRGGLGELLLPPVQPGSSIMPGKVNPVLCESVIQVACQVIGCDAAIVAGATGGVGGLLDLNVAMPMIAVNLLTSANLLSGVARAFEEKCLRELRADRKRCEELIERSLAMATALVPRIGYDAAAKIAKEAQASGKTVRDVCREQDVLGEAELRALLDPRRQTGI